MSGAGAEQPTVKVMIQPTDSLTVTLEAQTWDAVMRAMSGAPYHVAAPLIAEIQRQCRDQVTDRPNGVAVAAARIEQ
jgi:hypothetical protein